MIDADKVYLESGDGNASYVSGGLAGFTSYHEINYLSKRRSVRMAREREGNENGKLTVAGGRRGSLRWFSRPLRGLPLDRSAGGEVFCGCLSGFVRSGCVWRSDAQRTVLTTLLAHSRGRWRGGRAGFEGGWLSSTCPACYKTPSSFSETACLMVLLPEPLGPANMRSRGTFMSQGICTRVPTGTLSGFSNALTSFRVPSGKAR